MQTANCTCTANHAANKTVLRFAVQGHMAAGVASAMVVIKPRQVVPSPHVVPSAMQSPCADAAGAGAGAVAVLSTACPGRKPPFRALSGFALSAMRTQTCDARRRKPDLLWEAQRSLTRPMYSWAAQGDTAIATENDSNDNKIIVWIPKG